MLMVLLSGPLLAQATDAAPSGEDKASFGQGGMQTPLDQRRNAVTFGQMDVDGNGVLGEEEARQAGQLELFQRLDDGTGEVTRETFRDEIGSETLPEVTD